MSTLDLLNAVSGVPTHALLIIAIVALWRRVVSLEKALEDCLGKNWNKQSNPGQPSNKQTENKPSKRFKAIFDDDRNNDT